MALVPVSGTNIRLLSGVPFSNDYKHTRWFDTSAEQTAYFDGKHVVHSMSEANFQRIEGKNFIAVNKSIDELWNTNYLMFQNTEYNSKWFYAFVTKLEYKQKKTTYVHFQIDVFQTWKFKVDFKPSYVIREHCKLWNDDGSPVVNTVDEGLNYGSEYDVVSINNHRAFEEIQFLVIVAKQKMHDVVETGEGETENPSTTQTKIEATINGIPQPLAYYVHPFTADGGDIDSNISISNIKTVLKGLYTQDDAVNNIVSLFVTDYIGGGVTYVAGSISFDEEIFEHAGVADDTAENFNTVYLKDIKQYRAKIETIGTKYEGYKTVKESKLLMYPYTVLTLDDYKGSRVNYKNEYINSPDITILTRGSMGTSNKVSYTVNRYNTGKVENTDLTKRAELESSLISNNPSDVPILNDYLAAYLQGNRNSIQNQKDSIMFNGAMNGVGSALSGVGSAINRNPVGVAQAGADAVQGAGNTVLQLQAINAKQQDIANVPPSIGKMGSNTAFEFGNEYRGVFVIKKQIKDEYIKKLENFFNMFGYKLNETKVPNFHTRENWNFVHTQDCVVTGDLNNEDLQEYKNIFNNGITLWHTDDIGNYSLSNGVL